MRIFDFDPADYRDAYEVQGWVHIPRGVSAEFHEHLLGYAERELGTHKLEGFAIKGKKEQSLFEFPEGVEYPGELFDAIAALCGLKRPTMTLSERHIQAYEPNAAPEPPAHKDRFPSQVSVGLSISIPSESRLVLYPEDEREINPFNTSAGLRRHLQPEELPEVVLPAMRELEIDDQDRDVVIFPGSTTWHLRRRAANSLNLYLKVNDFDCDPLGEDPRTPLRREQTLAAVSDSGDGDLDSLVPAVSRRLDTVARTQTRNDWQEVLEVRMFAEEPFGITESQLGLLRATDGNEPLDALVERVTDGGDPARTRADLLRLAELGALDLLPPAAAGGGRSGAESAVTRG